jgi:hypothetical protein
MPALWSGLISGDRTAGNGIDGQLPDGHCIDAANSICRYSIVKERIYFMASLYINGLDCQSICYSMLRIN